MLGLSVPAAISIPRFTPGSSTLTSAARNNLPKFKRRARATQKDQGPRYSWPNTGPTPCIGDVGSSFNSVHSLFARNPQGAHVLLQSKLHAADGLRKIMRAAQLLMLLASLLWKFELLLDCLRVVFQ
jgi:hypothetical protein